MPRELQERTEPLSQAAVVAAALSLLEHEGEDGAGFNNVARALGVKPPSLYRHVASASLLNELVAVEGWRRFAIAAREASSRARTPRTILRAFADAQKAFAREHRALYLHMSATKLDDSTSGFADVSKEIFGLLDPPIEALGIRRSERTHMIRALRASVHGFVSLELSGQFGLPDSVDASFAWMISQLLPSATEHET